MSSVADLVVFRLREAGVRYLFGVPGGGSNLDLVAAAERAGLPFVLTATETAGAIAAIAQSEITGRPGACLTTLGPGVASVVNGVACARLERAPILVFTDAPASGTEFDHQRLDQRALLTPVTKWSTTIAPGNADEVIARAIEHTIAHPRGPVHIDCPADVLSLDSTSQPSDLRNLYDSRDLPDLADVPDPRDLPDLHSSTRPLLIAGLAARETATTSAIRALCASHRIPAMVTYKAKGVVPDGDPWFAGVFTNGASERPIAEASDLIVAVGLDPIELLPRPWTYAQPLIRVERSQLAQLPEGLRRSTWDADALQRMVAGQRESVCVSTDSLAPHRVVEIAAEAAPHARVTVDAGAHMFPATMMWPVDAPNRMLISNGLSTMGFALPAAIGAALLERQAEARGYVVALTGDGGLLICAGELATIARERLRIIVIVFDDRTLSLIDVKQQQRRLARSGVDVGFIDWRALAESVGICAWTAEREGALADALKAALRHDGPSLVDARVDPSGYAAILKAVRG